MVRAVARVSRGINLGQGATCIGREGTSRTGLVVFHSQISHRLASLVFSTETRWGAKKHRNIISFQSRPSPVQPVMITGCTAEGFK